MSYQGTGLGFTPLAVAAPAAGPFAPVVLAASFIPMAFKAISGLWTKDECKVEYDAARQQYWDRSAEMVDMWNGWKAAGQINFERARWILSNLVALANQFREYTDTAKQSCDPDWIEPRFHDYYDFFMAFVEGLKNEMVALDPQRMESGGILQSFGSAIARLVDPYPQQSYFPQAGTLPPVNTYPPPYTTSAGAIGETGAGNGLLIAGLALAAGMFLFRGRSRT